MAKNTPPGPGVDANGQSVIDPTLNVKEYVSLEVHRLDDLRDLTAHYVDEIAEIRAFHAKEMRKAETDRLDAIRENDQGQVQRAADVAQTALNALASQGTEQAETLRTQVESRAVTQESRLLAALDPIQKDIADLRRVQYEAVGGKQQTVETRDATADNKPILDAIQSLIVAQAQTQAALTATQTQKVESRATSSNIGWWIFGGIAAVGVIGGLFMTLVFGLIGLYLATRP